MGMEILFITMVLVIIYLLFKESRLNRIHADESLKYINNILNRTLKDENVNSTSKKKKISFKNKYKDVGLPVIPIKIMNHTYDFILDTGANFNALDKDQFKRIVSENELNIDPESIEDNGHGGVTITGVGGEQANVKDVTLTFSIDDEEFKESFSLVNIGQALETHGAGLHKLCGVIGSSFFEKEKWNIAFDELVVWMNEK